MSRNNNIPHDVIPASFVTIYIKPTIFVKIENTIFCR